MRKAEAIDMAKSSFLEMPKAFLIFSGSALKDPRFSISGEKK